VEELFCIERDEGERERGEKKEKRVTLHVLTLIVFLGVRSRGVGMNEFMGLFFLCCWTGGGFLFIIAFFSLFSSFVCSFSKSVIVFVFCFWHLYAFLLVFLHWQQHYSTITIILTITIIIIIIITITIIIDSKCKRVLAISIHLLQTKKKRT
jgi:hypothetical protein